MVIGKTMVTGAFPKVFTSSYGQITSEWQHPSDDVVTEAHCVRDIYEIKIRRLNSKNIKIITAIIKSSYNKRNMPF